VVAFENDWMCLATIDTRMFKEVLPQAPQPCAAAHTQNTRVPLDVVFAVHPVVVPTIRVETLAARGVTPASYRVAKMELVSTLTNAAPTAESETSLDHGWREYIGAGDAGSRRSWPTWSALDGADRRPYGAVL
jgi:hypothetical protein